MTPGVPRRRGPAAARASLLLVLLAALAVAVGARPATAHPAVAGSSPADGAELHEAPREVRISFGEDVEAPVGSLRVYDRDSQRVDLDDARRSGEDGRTVVATLRPDLPDGAYVVIWRAIGLDDGHLVLGQQSFVVGHAGPSPSITVAGARGAALTGAATAVSTLGGLATVVAAGAVLLALGPVPRRDPRWAPVRARLARLVHTAAAVGALASLASIAGLAAVRAAAFGTPLDLATVASVVTAPSGIGALARALLLTSLLAPLLLGLRWYVVGCTLLAVATLALDGHVGGVGLVAGLLHVAAVAVWAGGLVGLVVALPVVPARDAEGLAELLGSFSRTALRSVLAAGLAGGLLAIATVGPAVSTVAASPWAGAMTTKLVVLVSALLVAAHTRTVVLPALRAGVRPVPAGGAVGNDVVVHEHQHARDVDTPGRHPRGVVSAAPPGVLRGLRRNLVLEALLVAAVVLTSGVLADRATGATPASEAPTTGTTGVGTPCAAPAGMPLAHDCFPTLPDLRA